MSLPSQLVGSRWLHRVHLLLCPSKIVRHEDENTLFLDMVYSVLFYNVVKALNLYLNKYEAIAMALGCSPYHRGPT